MMLSAGGFSLYRYGGIISLFYVNEIRIFNIMTKNMISPEKMAKYRQTFYQRQEAYRQKNETRQKKVLPVVKQAVRKVMPMYPTVQRVYLFGSLIRPGAFRTDSDIDLGIEGVNMADCFDIWRDLEQIVTDWNFDVRPLEADDLFSERVRTKGVLIYECSTTNT